MKIRTRQNSENFRNDPTWFLVTLNANHSDLLNHEYVGSSNAPSPSAEMRKWFQSNGKGLVAFSYYEPVWMTNTTSVSHFVVDIWFSDANTAMMFKLSWA